MKTASQLAILVLVSFNVSAATLYVALESPSPSPPFATWATAATNIQQAVDAAARSLVPWRAYGGRFPKKPARHKSG